MSNEIKDYKLNFYPLDLGLILKLEIRNLDLYNVLV